MDTVVLKLKHIGHNKYALFAATGIQVGPAYRGSSSRAKQWAKAFCSTWSNWTVDFVEINDEKTN